MNDSQSYPMLQFRAHSHIVDVTRPRLSEFDQPRVDSIVCADVDNALPMGRYCGTDAVKHVASGEGLSRAMYLTELHEVEGRSV